MARQQKQQQKQQPQLQLKVTQSDSNLLNVTQSDP